VGSGVIAPNLLSPATWLKYVFSSHHACSMQTMLVGPKNSYGRSAVRVNIFLLPGIEARYFDLPVYFLFQLLGLINFQLYPPSHLYWPELGADQVGFVVDKLITKEVCVTGPIFFSVSIFPPSVRSRITFFHLRYHKV